MPWWGKQGAQNISEEVKNKHFTDLDAINPKFIFTKV